MYTYTQDQQQADKIMNYIRYYPNCIRKDIIKNCITNAHRLKYLENQGLIKLPDPMPRGLRNGLKLRTQNEKQKQT
jgi:hypothetical protein